MLRLVSLALDQLAPRRCLDCDRVLSSIRRESEETPDGQCPAFCADCAGKLPWWRLADGCPRCGWAGDPESNPGASCAGCYSQGSALHRSVALLRYEEAPGRWIRSFKTEQRVLGPPLGARLATEFFADELGRLLASGPPLDALLAIPLHPRRQRSRGFNQSALIARRVAQRAGLPFEPMGLRRHRATRKQALQRGTARRENLRGAFAAIPGKRLPHRIGLVDDVLTTGATLESAAECLLASGVEEVHALTLAATLPYSSGLSKKKAPGRGAVGDRIGREHE